MISSTLMAWCAVLLMAFNAVRADYVVFVHGLYGFGPNELLGVGYWGFPKLFGSHQNYIAQFERQGHQVLYASMGPLSSNHDRAAELYAQIKGTRVDYGLAHSRVHDHSRYGKDYTGKGFYPQWGPNNRIHLIGHSMGGNTIRYLEHLLQKGLEEEEAETIDGSLSLLYRKNKPGGNNWIQSVTTIASPLNGSPMSAMENVNMTDVHRQMMMTFGLVAGVSSLDVDWLYDFDLDHFGLDRKQGESFKTYFNRVFDSALFRKGFVDSANYDLSAESVRAFNAKSELTYPGTYYFSFSSSQTFVCSLSGDHCPESDMEIFMAPMAFSNGHLADNLCLSDGYCFNKVEWSENDGLVARKSSQGPEVGVRNYVRPTPHPRSCHLFKCRYDNSNLFPGVWYTRHVNRDHTQVIGLRFNLLEPDASGGIYTDIINTIDSVRLIPFRHAQDDVVSNDGQDNSSQSSSASNNVAAIATPIGVGFGLLLAAAGVITHRRRSNPKPSTKAMMGEIRSSSIVVSRGEQQTSDNPLFVNEIQRQDDLKV